MDKVDKRERYSSNWKMMGFETIKDERMSSVLIGDDSVSHQAVC